MLSYKQWKTFNESVLPSFSLGLGRPSSLGLVSQFGFDEMKMAKKKAKKKMEDGEIVKAKRKADKPEVEVDVDGEDSEENGVCGSMCGSKSKKHSAKKCKLCMKSKKKMWSDEDDQDEEKAMGDEEEAEEDEEEAEEDEEEAEEDEEEDEEDEEEANEAYSKKHMDSDEDEDEDEEEDEEEDEDEEEGDSEDEDHDDHDHEHGHDKKDHEEDHDEDEEEADAFKMSKKKMLKGGQHKLDMNKDGKISGEDFKLMHKMKKGKKGKKHDHGDKHEHNEEEAWWNSVRSMMGPSDAKYSDGFFSLLDTDNLYQAVRNEE